jgi:putative peptide zinc metalloprotease protein
MEVHRQPTGDDVEYFLQDHSLGKFYRFNLNAYDILGRLDGERTVNEVWEDTIACLGDDAPSQDEIIDLLGRMHAIDALQLDVTPDCLELLQRTQRNKKVWWKSALRSPLSLRIPLLDPERALAAMMPFVGPIFSRIGFAVWLLVMIWAISIAAMHWPELSRGGIDQILDPKNLLLLLFVYPIVKIFHEFGHAISTRKWGGEVHEMGITFLVFMPIPYVDASAMSAISSKHRRMLISASGMMVELFLAALALLVWINVEPGLIRLTAFNIMLVGGISTLIFNGNPLLRFDAYYILKDAIEIPNLASRSSRYLAYLTQRYAFGLENAESPVSRDRERPWFLCYGIASMLFRVFMTFTIVLFIAGQYFIVGVLMAIWAFTLLVGVPLSKGVRYLFFNGALDDNRSRAVLICASVLAIVCSFIVFAPVPSATQAHGVLWLPDKAHVHAGTSGVVTKVWVKPSTDVEVGQALISLADPLLKARINVLKAELDELRVQHRIESLDDQVKAMLTKEKILSKQAELGLEAERFDNLVIRSSKNGMFVLDRAADLLGRHVRQGQRLGFVLDQTSMTVKVAVPQNRIGMVRESLSSVEVKLADSIKNTIPATLTRGVPAAQKKLPSKVLGLEGGGKIAIDPADKEGLETIQSVFMLDVALDDEPSGWRIGQRAYVKFDHGNQPLAEQWYRLGRQLFIRRFGV